jgi:ankyrin repeat protein
MALRFSSENGHLDMVKYLVEHGADIHAKEDYALRWASLTGRLKVVIYLVEHGADIQAKDDEALRTASYRGRLEVVKFLVEHGVNHANGVEALHTASANGHEEIVAFLTNFYNPVSIFDVPLNTECSICLEEVRIPYVLCTNGHPHCHACIQTAWKHSRKCPLCRTITFQ